MKTSDIIRILSLMAFFYVIRKIVENYDFDFIKNFFGKKEGMTSYGDCLKSGFTKEFCVQTPISTFGPGFCQCDNGQIGQRMPGFKGECVCVT